MKTASNILSLLLLSLVVVVTGCEEEDVPFVVDDEEIARYINNSEDARGLFRVDGIYPAQPYTMPFDPGAGYIDVIDSTAREIDIDAHVDTVRKFQTADGFVEYYRLIDAFPSPIGEKWHAEAIVDDFFYGRRLRIEGTDTTAVPFTRVLTRYGFFLKLGSDQQEYFGWKLWAFNGGGPESGTFIIDTDNNGTFRGDLAGYNSFEYTRYRIVLSTNRPGGGESIDSSAGHTQYAYKRLDELPALSDGVNFYLDANDVSTDSHLRLVSAETNSGFELFAMDKVTEDRYVDSIATRNNTSRLWNLLGCQEYRRVQIPGSNPPQYTLEWNTWVVPYRIPQ